MNRSHETRVRPKAILVGLLRSPEAMEQVSRDLDELRQLVEDAGGDVVDILVQHRSEPHPAYYIGKGKAHEIAARAEALQAELVVFDDSLKPNQVRNLERIIPMKIIDRVQLILDIFARRARTREGQLQVELAQLKYLLPRLTGKGAELSRLGGGIGTRGPGETLLEVKQRAIRRRIRTIQKELRAIAVQHREQRALRRERQTPVFALVGYTNAGKSSLFNRLTGADAVARFQLFTTLDPLVRRIQLGDMGEVLISDTVGFIRKLPPRIVAAFRATLEEVYDAFALIHVIDITSPRIEPEIQTVESILGEIGVGERPIIRVFNKVDLIEQGDTINHWRLIYPEAVFTSARTGEGIDLLLKAMAEWLRSRRRVHNLRVPYHAMHILERVYSHGHVRYREDRADGIYMVVEVPPWLEHHLKAYIAETDPVSE